MHTSDTADDLAAQSSVIHYLIRQNADINVQDIYWQTPLHYACMRGNEVACQELLSYKNKVNLEVNIVILGNQL